MGVAVHFPDGSIRTVPGQLRASGDRHRPRFEQIPLNCDSLWRFARQNDMWRAEPRFGSVTLLQPTVPDWWSAIGPMADAPVHRDNDGREAAA